MRIGIDLGGTKIEAIALADDGAERFRRRVPTPAGDYDATVRAIVSLVADKPLEQSTRVDMLEQLCALWMDQTNCSLDEIVGVINDPVPS